MAQDAPKAPPSCSSKIKKTLGPFVEKGLRPPAGTLRGPTCSFTCVLQAKLALGLQNPQFLPQLLEGPKGPPGGPQEASKRPPCSHAPKRPPRGPQEAPRRPPRARISEWSLRFPRFWRGTFLAYVTVVSAPSAPRRVPPCLKVVKMQGPFAKNASWQVAACLCTLCLPCHGPFWLLFPLPCFFKSVENARTIRQKSSQASGRHAQRPNMQFLLCFTIQNCSWAQKPLVFT